MTSYQSRNGKVNGHHGERDIDNLLAFLCEREYHEVVRKVIATAVARGTSLARLAECGMLEPIDLPAAAFVLHRSRRDKPRPIEDAEDLVDAFCRVLAAHGLECEDNDGQGMTVNLPSGERVRVVISELPDPWGEFPRKATQEEIKAEWYAAWDLYRQMSGDE